MGQTIGKKTAYAEDNKLDTRKREHAMTVEKHSYTVPNLPGVRLDGGNLSGTNDEQKTSEYVNTRAMDRDKRQHPQDAIIERILDNAKVTKGSRVLNLGCDTGTIVPYYLRRGAASVVVANPNASMLDMAGRQFAGNDNVSFLYADAETDNLGSDYDVIMIYNAWPYFPHPQEFIDKLSSLLKIGGILSVAHDMDRETLHGVHRRGTAVVSSKFFPTNTLATMFDRDLTVYKIVDTVHLYQVCGMKE